MARRIETTEPDKLAAALLGASAEFLPIDGHRFASRLCTLGLGEMLMQVGENGAHVSHVTFDAGLTGLVVPLDLHASPVRVNGSSLSAVSAILAPGGAEFRTHAPAGVGWAALALPTWLLEELGDRAPAAIGASPGVKILALHAGAAARLTATLGAAARMTDRLPDMLHEPGCIEALTGSLEELVAETLAPDIPVRLQRRATRVAMRVVRDVEDFLHANLARPIHRQELCAALGISPRKLHDAFIGTVGMTASAYLKTRRLMMVRRALKSGGGTGRHLVKSAALGHGFWHLGHFARDYRALFGELPSATLDAAAVQDRRGIAPRPVGARSMVFGFSPIRDSDFTKLSIAAGRSAGYSRIGSG